MQNKPSFLPLLATLGILLAGCAAPPVAKESVILLPQADGKPSAVVVRSKGQEVVLDKPYMTASFDAGKIAASQTSAESVQATYSDLIAADPPGPKQFLLFYEPGDIRLTAESLQLYERVKAELKNYPAGEVVVIAHTDRTGSEKSNDKLSMRRAESVRAFLIDIGIPADIIQVAGRGEHEPLVPTRDGVAEAKNRRVELKVR
ncbi:MAG TPA: OmpA family protein [Gallionella sp.]